MIMDQAVSTASRDPADENRMRSTVKRVVNKVFGLAGLEVRGRHPSPFSLAGALRRARGTPVRTVIDVGASDGRWSREAMDVFPEASYLLIEAQQGPHEVGLRKFCQEHPNAKYILAAAGERTGTIHFDASDPFGGAASETPCGANDIEVPVTTIDIEVEQRRLEPPFLIKLDTHGFEVPILQGALHTLKSTNMLIIEAYNFKFHEGCLRFHELCSYMDGLGFRCSDIFDVHHRPRDGLLWQLDMVFISNARREFQTDEHY
jgi:FkbM family methyltransferase